jgi:general secretion pathway protein K
MPISSFPRKREPRDVAAPVDSRLRGNDEARGSRGSVLVVVLWTLTLLSILVAVIASQVRLSAQAAHLHRDDLQEWAALTSALNQAEMEIFISRMPPSLESRDLEDIGLPEQMRFNGQPLTLRYAQDPNIVVRIYDHAGKINLRNIRRGRLRELLQKRLGGDEADPAQLDALMAAWDDWTDLNDAAAPTGAESDYYLSLDPPYRPRNGPIESVEEILLIKGFAELFADIDLDAAFTLYDAENDRINLNLATVEAMRLLPGLDDAMIRDILAYRAEKQFAGAGDVAQVVPAENLAVLRPWLNNTRGGFSNYFTILVYPRLERPDADGVMQDVAATALGEVIEVTNSTTTRPRVFKMNPYQHIPLRVLPPEPEE